MNKTLLSLLSALLLAVCCAGERAEARVCVSVGIGLPVCVPRVCVPMPRVYVPAPFPVYGCVPPPPPCPRYDHYHYRRPHHPHHHHCGPHGGRHHRR